MDANHLRLYVIPDRFIGAPISLVEQTELALKGGATSIQLRDKSMSGRELYSVACEMVVLCHRYEALFFVNDRLDVALACGADGCHLGQSDLPVAQARKIVPSSFFIGQTARNLEQARIALDEGADYLGVGAVYPTGTKNDTSVIGLKGLKEVASSTSLPVVAIGGIGVNSINSVISSEAAGVALVSAVVGQPYPEEVARSIREKVDRALYLQMKRTY